MYWERGAILVDGAPPGRGRPKGGEPVLMSIVNLIDGTRDRRCLNTDDPKVAAVRMKRICTELVAAGRLRADSKPSKIYAGGDEVVPFLPAQNISEEPEQNPTARLAAQLPEHHGAPAAIAVISWEDKLREAARIACLGLSGRATALAVILLVYLNHEHGVAFPSVDELLERMKVVDRTIERANRELADAGAVKLAKRHGAPVRWLPALLDMTPDEARAKVRNLRQSWRTRTAEDPTVMSGHVEPTKAAYRDPTARPTNLSGPKTPSNQRILIGGGGSCGPSEQAFALVKEIAGIAGLPRDSTRWPKCWREGQSVVQVWLNAGWDPKFCIDMAAAMMRTKQGGPPNSIRYFEPAIRRAYDALPGMAK